MSGETVAKIIGGVLGASIAGYALIYAPMMANIEARGCPWLQCPEFQPREQE